jgi:hypothetical protein
MPASEVFLNVCPAGAGERILYWKMGFLSVLELEKDKNMCAFVAPSYHFSFSAL